MAFWDVMKGAAQSAGSYAKSQVEDLQSYKDEYCMLSDKKLYRKMQNSSGAKKLACLQLLKERGYHPDRG